jgi:heavy metal translocating P-type ATPase
MMAEADAKDAAAADDGDANGTDEQRALLVRLFAGTLMAGFVMVLSLAISTGYGFGALRQLEHDIGTAHWVLLVAAVPALLLLGPAVLRSAWSDLRDGRLTLNVLFTLGTTSAVAVSAVSYVRGTGPIYLETAVMLLALYTLGRYLTARAKGRATRVLRRLIAVPDATYVRLRRASSDSAEAASATACCGGDGAAAHGDATHADAEGACAEEPGAEEVPPDALRVGDRIRVRAGDVIPVDGCVVEGESYVDESSLTGEAQPAVRTAGDAVYAGTEALDGALTIDVEAVDDERRLARVEQMMRQALERPPRIAQLTDRILTWLIPGVVVLALGTFGAWWWAAGFAKALYVALSVVLITCPCALGIAIPLALVIAMDEAAREGILMRSGRTLLDLADVDAVAFDKTGTLSALDAPSVDVWIPDPVSTGDGHVAALDADDVLRRAAAVERGTRHALATAIIHAADARDLQLPAVQDVTTHAGAGVVGTVEADGLTRRVGVGNERLLDTLGASCPPDVKARFQADVDSGRTPLFVTEDGAVVALTTLEEQPTSDAAAAVEALRGDGCSVTMLTGDRPEAADRLSARLGLDTAAALSPETKVEHLNRLRDAHGPVAMVGDGINDAAALAEADVGVALSSGASVSMEAADVTLYDPDLRLIPWLRHLAQKTRRIIRQNLWWTFGYNAVGLGLAVAGLLHPIAAVVIMTLSSLLVTGNAFRLRRLETPDGIRESAAADR